MVGQGWIARDDETWLGHSTGRMGARDQNEGGPDLRSGTTLAGDNCGVDGLTDDGRDVLSFTIEREIIPSLMRAHSRITGRRGEESRSEPARAGIDLRDVEKFVELVLSPSPSKYRAFFQDLVDAQLPLERIFAGLLVPAARHIGDLWMADRCSFTDVTIGVARLQQLLSEHGTTVIPPSEANEVGRILLAPAPREQHTFGLHVVAEFFRRDGWTVSTQVAPPRAEFQRIVERESFDMVGFTISNADLLEPLAEVVESIRGASRNPNLVVMIGGSPEIGLEETADVIGATAHAPDAKWAVQYMHRHLDDGSGKRGR